MLRIGVGTLNNLTMERSTTMNVGKQTTDNAFYENELEEFISLLEEVGVAEELRARDMRNKNAIINPQAVTKLKEIHDAVRQMAWNNDSTSVKLKEYPVGSHASIVLTTDFFGTSKITHPLFKQVLALCDGINISESNLGEGIIRIAFHVNNYLLEV